ncbi:MAG TPA: sigma factor-like helix-turn-helix DNA-binding protein [Rhodanobacteraceae bacterium]
MARRCRYLALLRRWAQERLPAGTRAALDAADWARDVLIHTAMNDVGARGERSLLVRMRTSLAQTRHSNNETRLRPSPRVEQLIGCDQLEVWESALAALPLRQRELVILRIEFGLDYAAIAEEAGLPAPVARSETVNALAALIDALVSRQRARAA